MQKPRSCLAVQQPGTLKKLQPIFRLIAFLERNLELGNKVARPWAYLASRIFAPMEVAERSS